jgi:hypothetical protein
MNDRGHGQSSGERETRNRSGQAQATHSANEHTIDAPIQEMRKRIRDGKALRAESDQEDLMQEMKPQRRLEFRRALRPLAMCREGRY